MLQENLKILRTQKGMSQEELAERLTVVRQTVSKWEKGLSVPDSEMLIKIAEVFEVSVGELLGETIQPEPEKTELQQLADKLENLNAMMAERNARSRSLMRIAAICIIAAASVFALVELLPIVLIGVLTAQQSHSGSVGIIGGADGPTSIFISASPDWGGLALGTAIFTVVLVAGILLLRKSGKR